MTLRQRVFPFVLRNFGTTNPNAMLYIVYLLCMQFSDGMLITGQVVLYLTQLTNSKSKVGYAEAVFGVFGLLPGLLGGYFADRGRRDTVMYCGGAVTAVGVAIVGTMCILYLVAGQDIDDDLDSEIPGLGSYQFLLCCVGLAIIYAGTSIGNAASQAILADSIATGTRLKFNTSMSFYGNIVKGLGPASTVAVSALQHNKWTEQNLAILVLIGVVIRIPCIATFFMFNDDRCLQSGAADSLRDAAKDGRRPSPRGKPTSVKGQLQARSGLVPRLYFVSDVLWCFGSGMTVKFFPIFFKEPLGLSPVIVFTILTTLPYVGLPVLKIARKLAEMLGRIQAEFLLWAVGIMCLGAMSLFGFLHCFNSRWEYRIPLILLFLVRTAVLQSTGPIQQSVVMDYVSKANRAKWASLATLTSAGWSGSAAVGGYLIEHYSFQLCFAISCGFYLLSLAVKIPLLWIVPKKQSLLGSKGPHVAALLSIQRTQDKPLEEYDLYTIFAYLGTAPEKDSVSIRADPPPGSDDQQQQQPCEATPLIN